MKKIACLVFLFSLTALAQVNPGTPNFGASDSHEYDTVDLQNLNVVLTVPVMSKSGAIPFSYGLNANYYIYAVATPNAGTRLQANTSGLIGSPGIKVSVTNAQISTKCGNGTATTKLTNWAVIAADGTVHALPTSDYTDSQGCFNASFVDVTTDGSGYTLSVTKNVVNSLYDSGGNNFSNPGINAFITDSNGNTITPSTQTSGYIDTLGLQVLSTAGGSPSQTYSWTDTAGGAPTATLVSSTQERYTNFKCPLTPDNFPSSGNLNTAVDFPDGTSLQMLYEPTGGPYTGDVTGRLSQLTLRDGSSLVSYNYNPSNAANSGLNCTYLVPNSLTRMTGADNFNINYGTTTYTLAFIPTPGGSGNYYETDTVIDPGGNKKVYTFTGFTAYASYSLPTIQALTQVQNYINTGTVQKPVYSSTPTRQDVYCYNGVTSGCATAIVSLPVTERDIYTTLYATSGSTSSTSRLQVQYDGGPSGTLPHYGNVTYLAQYDFGATSPTFQTTTTYGSWNSSTSQCASIGNNVNNKPCQIVMTNGNSTPNTISISRFTYSPQGNLLTKYVSPNGGTSYLSNPTKNVYNSNGTISTAYDVAGNATIYTYDPNSYYCSLTVICGTLSSYPFPTSIKKGGLTTSSTWYAMGGVKRTDTDANVPTGNTTTYSYEENCGSKADPWWRLGSVTDPMSNQVCKAYTATSFSSSFAFGSSVNNTTTTTDGFGRPMLTQKQQGLNSTAYDTVATGYHWGLSASAEDLFSVTTSLPCQGTLGFGGNCPSLETDQDVLGRVVQTAFRGFNSTTNVYTQNDVLTTVGPASSGENVKQVQNEYDGLGRLTSSCAISSTASGNVLCKQNTNTSATGVLTTTSYSSTTGSQTVTSTRGGQPRSRTVDGLGRVTSITTPEGGTTISTYDGTACGSSVSYPGHLTVTSYPNGTVDCFQYNDASGRMTDSEGVTSAGAGYCKRWRYDASSNGVVTPPSGATISNAAGRLVEAETDSCASPITSSSIITDEWFSYDQDGRMTDMWELTPHSTQYYHSKATFYANSAVNTLTLTSPSLYGVTYTLDGEGRWNTLTSATTSVVTGTTYNAAGQPTNINLEGTDNDVYVYDSFDRMTNWIFTVNSVSETGTLTWNPNSTLKQLQVQDGFNAGGSQTCNYNPTNATGTGYDDLGRLVGVDCGSGGWGQTFTYDQFDNLNKAVPTGRTGVTWATNYYSLNNHYSPSTTYTYDGSGNITYDSFNTYAWDGYNKMASTNGSGTNCSSGGRCMVYDAMGRLVEMDYNGGASHTEIWYTQLGKTAYMNGTTISYAYWPAPGGGTLLEVGNQSNLYYMHKDRLGNARVSSGVQTHAIITDRAFAPYGEVYDTFGSTAQQETMFTGDTQDILAGMYDTPNREMNANQGRWFSPDPAGSGWNQYAYATNPNSFTDPSGLCFMCQFGGNDAKGSFTDPYNGELGLFGNWLTFEWSGYDIGQFNNDTAGGSGPAPASGWVAADGGSGAGSGSGVNVFNFDNGYPVTGTPGSDLMADDPGSAPTLGYYCEIDCAAEIEAQDASCPDCQYLQGGLPPPSTPDAPQMTLREAIAREINDIASLGDDEPAPPPPSAATYTVSNGTITPVMPGPPSVTSPSFGIGEFVTSPVFWSVEWKMMNSLFSLYPWTDKGPFSQP